MNKLYGVEAVLYAAKAHSQLHYRDRPIGWDEDVEHLVAQDPGGISCEGPPREAPAPRRVGLPS